MEIIKQPIIFFDSAILSSYRLIKSIKNFPRWKLIVMIIEISFITLLLNINIHYNVRKGLYMMVYYK